jgi:hypothetical protein
MPDLDQIKQGEQASARPARGRSLKPPTIEDTVKAGGSPGRPEDIVEQLKAVEKRYPGVGRRRQGAAVITKGDEHARPPA